MSQASRTLSIGAVERETGLSKDTLRAWERRYDFPRPVRGGDGERCYPPDQVEKLRVVRRLLDCGVRPGKVIGLDCAALRALLDGAAPRASPDAPCDGGPDTERPDLARMLELCRGHSPDRLRADLSQTLMRLGMFRFVSDVAAPLTTLVGRAWAAGALAVYEEHLYTEALHAVLRHAIAALAAPARGVGPRVLLTTVPGEAPGLGRLMAEAMLTLEGACCVPLGVQTPLADIVRAAAAQRVDVVALSFSGAMRPALVREGLDHLRADLPDTIALWAGGGSAALRRYACDGVTVLDLEAIGAAAAAWRGQAGDVEKPRRLL